MTPWTVCVDGHLADALRVGTSHDDAMGGHLVTKDTSKGIKASSGTSKAEGAQDKAKRGVGSGRPRLHVSHGTKASTPKPLGAGKAPAAASGGPRTPTIPPRGSVPPRPKRTTKVVAPTNSEAGQLALAIAGAALEKKAGNVEIIDLGGKADYADYLVLMTGGSDRHIRALSDAIQESLEKKHKTRALSVEGMTGGSWILVDFGTVVAHVFQENVRALYDIEGLWMDAARVPVPSER